MSTEQKSILVLGVGNILYTDEGLGVRCVERLQERYDFSDNVTLMDGGTQGMRLMDPIMQSDFLIVVDAVLGDKGPGSIYRLKGEDLRKSIAFTDSMHQIDLLDTLAFCEVAGGKRPEAIIVGMEPADYQTMAIEPSQNTLAKMDEMVDAVLKEIEAAGGAYTKRQEARDLGKPF